MEMSFASDASGLLRFPTECYTMLGYLISYQVRSNNGGVKSIPPCRRAISLWGHGRCVMHVLRHIGAMAEARGA